MIKIPDYTIQETVIPLSVPWNLSLVNAPSFWEHSKGGGRVVAVIDTGCQVDHPELAGKIINPRNLVDGSSNVADTVGHGTHVSGIIAGTTVGVAPEARIMPLKVANADGSLNGTAIEEAFITVINWNKSCAIADKVVAINCSFGAGSYDSLMAFYIRELVAGGVIVCVAAGNSGDGDPTTSEIFSYPAYISEVVTTASINQDGSIAIYSNSFDGVDVAAPGTNIYSSWPGSTYKTISGTSMATPHITGSCALLADMFYKREGRFPTESEIDGSCPNFLSAEGILFKHIRKVPDGSSYLFGRGILDLTYQANRWPLYRVQTGAFYNQAGQVETEAKLKTANFSTYKVKY